MNYISLALICMITGTAFAGGGGYYYGHGVKVQQVVIPQRVVQFDARYFEGVDNYFSLGEKLKTEKQAEKADEAEFYKGQIKMLLEIMAAQQAGGKPLPAPVNPNPGVDPPPAPQPVPPAPVPEDNNSGDYKVTEIDKKVFGIFSASCAKCHGDSKQDGGLTLIKGGALQLVDLADRAEIYDRVLGVGLEARGKAKMPKGGVLSDNDVESLRLWMMEESDRIRNGGN
jgi:mono/diheme cytochrome c family protein